MADASISVAVGADVTAYERGMQKAQSLGKSWARDFSTSAATVQRQSSAASGSIGQMASAFGRLSGALGLIPAEVNGVFSALRSVFAAGGGGPIAIGLAAIAAGTASVFSNMRKDAEDTANHIASVMQGLAKREAETSPDLRSADPKKRAQALIGIDKTDDAKAIADDYRRQARELAAGANPNTVGGRFALADAAERGAVADDIDKMVGKQIERQMKERQEAAASERVAAEKRATDQRKLQEDSQASSRAIRIATAPSEDAQNRLRQQFIREDFGAARERRGAAVSAGRTDEATREAIEMRKLMVEFVTLQKEVAKNTKGGARL